MRKDKPLPFLRRKTAKGRTYFYFDTGTAKNGRPVLTRLPDIGDKYAFGAAYARQVNARTQRGDHASELTFRRMADLFEKSPEFKRLSTASQRLYAGMLVRGREELGDAPAHDIRRRDVLLLRDKMADTPGMANLMVGVLAALYKWGRNRDHVSKDVRPTEEIEPLEMGEHQPWPEDLVEAALASNDARVRLSVALLYFTAQRIGDVGKMRWSDVRDGSITMTQQKTGKTLEIKLHRDLARILEATPKTGLTIIAQPNGRTYSRNSISEHIQKFAKARGYKVVAHGLRKNAVNALLEAGCTIAETSAVSGQSLTMVEHYAKGRNQPKLSSAAVLKWQGSKRESENR